MCGKMYGMELMGLLSDEACRDAHMVACPCCHGVGEMLLYSAERGSAIPQRVCCCHCGGTGEVAAEVTPILPVKSRRSWREWWWFT